MVVTEWDCRDNSHVCPDPPYLGAPTDCRVPSPVENDYPSESASPSESDNPPNMGADSSGGGLCPTSKPTDFTGGAKRVQPTQHSLRNDCESCDWDACPRLSPPGDLVFSDGVSAAASDAAQGAMNALATAASVAKLLRESTMPSARATEGCTTVGGPCRVNLVTGSMVVQIRTPALGPFDPRPILTFNSTFTDAEEFGNRWKGSYKAHLFVSADLKSVYISRGTGVTDLYTQAVDGSYTPPPGAKNSLVRNANETWTETQPDGFQTWYDATDAHWAYRMNNRAGATWTMTFEPASFYTNLVSITDPFHRRTTFSYNVGGTNDGTIRSITDSGGRITTFVVDDQLNLRRIVTPELCVTSFSYDANYRMTGWVDPMGGRTTYAYNLADPTDNKVYLIVSPRGGRRTLSYDTTAGRTAVTDPNGNTTNLTYTSASLLSSVTDPLGLTTTYVWDQERLAAKLDALGRRTSFLYATLSDGTQQLSDVIQPAAGRFTFVYDQDRVVGLIDQRGNRSTLAWDMSGNRIGLVNAEDRRTSYAYDANGQTTAITTPLSAISTRVYDAIGMMTAEVDPLGRRTLYAYDVYGQKRRDQDPLGRITTYLRDGVNRLVAKIDPYLERTSYTYDANGRLTATIDPLGNVSTRLYDADGNLVAMVDPLSNRTSYVYDLVGNRVRAVDPLGRITTTVYDHDDRPIATIDPLGDRTSYAYDFVGNRVGVTDPLGRMTATVYDADDRPIATIDPLGHRSTLAYDGTGNAFRGVDPLVRITTTIYDVLNRAGAVIDPLANRTSYSYDAAGRLIAATDPLGQRTTTVYDVASQMLAVVNPLGNRTSFSYDDAGRRVHSQDPLGRITTSAYDLDGRLIQRIDPLHNTTGFLYDAASRMISLVDPLGHRTTTVYDDAGRPIALLDPLRNRTTTVYDSAGQPIRVVDAKGGLTTGLYDRAGRLVAAIDPLGHRTSYAYNAADERVRVTDALGRTATTVYDAASRVVATIDPLANRTSHAYDAADQRLRVVDPLGRITTTVYDAAGRVVSMIDPLANTVGFAYDRLGRRVRFTDPLSKITTSLYDTNSRLQAVVDPLGNRTTSSYDVADQRYRTTDPLGNLTTTVYDAASRVRAVIDPLSNRMTQSYDAAGRLVTVTDPNARATTTVYDAAGRPIAVVNALGSRASVSYDPLGRRIAVIDPIGNRTSYAHDAASREILRIDGRGLRTSYNYDAASRPTGRRYPDGTRVTQAYDAVNNRTLLSDATGRTTSTYDALRRLASIINPAGIRLTYSYDAVGRRATLAQPETGRFTYAYDAAGRLRRLANPQDQITSWVYDAANRVTVNVLANGTRASYTYDAANRLVRLANLGTGGATLSSFAYAYDAVGNRTRVAEAGGSRVSWTYDPTYQLTRELRSGSNPYAITYAYDPAGNRLQQRDGGVPTTYVYDAANQLVRQQDPGGITTSSYDGAGNLAATRGPLGQRTTYSWDTENRLTAVALPSALANTFAYDGDGHRVGKTDSGGTTGFVWDGENVLLETGGFGFAEVATVLPSATGYTDAAVAPGTAYTYRVRAYSADGTSGSSNNAGGTPTGSATSATYLGQDTATQGGWGGAYGADGSDLAADTSAINPVVPAYATVVLLGQSDNIWSTTTTDVHALQKASGTGRIAACWFSSSSFDIDINFTDGQAHRVSVYALDWNNVTGTNSPVGARSQRFDVIDPATATVLDSRTISNFLGVYLSWTIQGNVTIRVTNLVGGTNAVVSGVFLGGGGASAGFLGQDASTLGAWRGACGGDGFDLAEDTSGTNPNLPSYATVSLIGKSDNVWSTTTTDAHALANAGGTGQIAAAWYSASSFDINVALSDGQAHRVTVYALDWNNVTGTNPGVGPRSQRFDVIDVATATVLDSRTISNFLGVYLSWTVRGSVTIRVTNLVSGSNAEVSALFFGDGGAAAVYQGQDTATVGGWEGTYGVDGYDVAEDSSGTNPVVPSYATVTLTGQSDNVWSTTTSDTHALENIAGTGRIAACWYSTTSFDIDVALAGGQGHRVSVYALDWNNVTGTNSGVGPRSQRFDVIDVATGVVLDSRTISDFLGVYLTWTVRGSVTIRVTNLVGGNNAVVSGVFLDTAAAAGAPSGLSATGSSGQVALSWTNHATGATGVRIERATAGGSGLIRAVYTLEPARYGNLVSQRRGGATSYYHFDGLGSTDALTDGTGAVADGYVYDAFGTILAIRGSVPNALRYVGRSGYWYEPDLGLYLLRARWYDPATGRFLSRDPIGIKNLEVNYYRYCFNNATDLIDPAGEYPSPPKNATPQQLQSYCDQLYKDMWDSLNTLSKRKNELQRDPLNLRFKHWRKCDADPTTGWSIEGHQEQFQGWQRRLRTLLQLHNQHCDDRGPSPPSRAWPLSTIKTPAPDKSLPAKPESLNDGGPSGWSLYRDYLKPWNNPAGENTGVVVVKWLALPVAVIAGGSAYIFTAPASVPATLPFVAPGAAIEGSKMAAGIGGLWLITRD